MNTLKSIFLNFFFLSFNSLIASQSLYDIQINTLENKNFEFNKLKGKVVLIVNVASRCGFTSQYKGLQELWESYKNKNFVIIGVPSNDFGNQEPGSHAEIGNFCRKNYGVTFPLTEKIKVTGRSKHELYSFLTNSNKNHSGEVKWNFYKYLIDTEGQIVHKYNSLTKPTSKKLKHKINELLKASKSNKP